ncbi:hypothetical protein KVV02_007937 [Mortierella alpina]|uniref:Cas1p 10 TM acyl transferase domain-containing protein n=1 Tax=Mortierella alpina TaxID=64518 RepID=A0A9P8A3E5_MORAP|nr:hypothetical protein KVV02_007937 [Mortierella alpina]
MQLTSFSTNARKGSTIPIQALFWGVAAAAISLAGLRHVFDPADSTRCKSLLNDGSWLDNQRTQWQPKGCMLRPYDTQHTKSCLGGSRVVMIGDSVVRQLYYSLVKKVLPEANTDGDRHSDIFFQDPVSGTAFEFYWDPVLNSTKTMAILDPSPYQQTPDGDIPSIFLVGSGLWYLRYSEWTGGLEQWRQRMDELVQAMRQHGHSSLGHNLFISPISAVNTDKLSEERLRTLLPKDIEEMNNYLREAVRDGPMTVPFSWNKMTMTAASATKDGLHYVEKVMTAEADVLLNFVCNNKLTKVAPMAATCCYDYPNNSGVQTFMLLIFLVWLPMGYIVQTYYRQHPSSALFPSAAILRAFLIVAASVVYMYYADRTSLFAKGNKMFSASSFASLTFLSIAAGCLTLKKADKEQPFLSRDQTDEWKGWMQIIILIYHYVGASSVSAIYNPVRMLVASYLFMTGFGHFVFFYKKADFGFVRVASILTRLNLLTILLTYTMETTYLSYYFAPLVSFFYLIIYAMMYIGHSYNHNPVFIVSKIVVTAILTATMVHTPAVLDSAFGLLHFLFGVTWSASEWRFRLQLDVWIVFVGALFAFVFIKAQELSITTHPHWNAIRQTTIATAVVGLLGYFVFEASMQKLEYNHYHPYVSWIPILAFVVLRNSTASLRNTTSTFYAFIGKCSLETFICQFHIWLAGDTKGILVLWPWIGDTGSWTINLAVSTLLFVCLSHTLSGATGVLSDWLITGREPKSDTSGPSAVQIIIPQHQPPPPLSVSTPLSALSSSQDRESPGPLLPLNIRRQSVMVSPISVSAGTVGPSTLKKLMDASLLREATSPSPKAAQNEAGLHPQQAEDPSRGFYKGSHDQEKNKSQGSTSSNGREGEGSSKRAAVALQIDTTNTEGASSRPCATSVPSPTSVTFKSLWMQPTWKVIIFFSMIWVLNYVST